MRLLFTVISMLFIQLVNAQVITGKVIDALSHQPLESAIVSGTGDAIAFTDHAGNFIIRVNDAKTNLRISYIGYKAVAIPVTTEKNVRIELHPDIIRLDEVIISNQDNHIRSLAVAKTDLNLKPVKNSQELLRTVPGLFVAQHAGGGKAEQIFLRGFDIDHGTDLSVSVDDMPVNMVSHAHGQGYADAHFIIPETISDIDFGAGPYYSGQGNMNTAGYVNFKTYKSISKSRVQLEGGRFDTYRALVMADVLKKNKATQNAYIASELNFTNGPTISPQKFHRINIFSRYNLALTGRSNIDVTVSAFDSKWNASGQIPGRSVESGMITRYGSIDPTEGGTTSRYNVIVAFNSSLSENSSLDTKVYYSRYHFDLFSNFTFYLNDPVNGDGIRQKEDRNIYGWRSVLRVKNIFDTYSLNSQYGGGMRYDDVKGSALSQQVRRRFLQHYQVGDIKEMNAFAFIQQQLTTGKWTIETGIRLDYFRFLHINTFLDEHRPAQSKMIIAPKVNVQYNITRDVQLYAKAGKGFHSNDARVVVAQQGKQVLPAAYGTDIGICIKPVKDLFITLAAWHLYLQQEFVYVGDEGITEPGGRTMRKGIDVLARWQLTDHLFTSVNMNFTRAKAIDEAKGQDHIPLAPLFTSTGGIFYKAKRGFNGGLNYRFMKDRPANEDNSVVAKGYFLLDGALNYTTKKYEVGMSMENILNAEWNEAQFATTSRLKHESDAVTELHYTPGVPFSWKLKLAVFF